LLAFLEEEPAMRSTTSTLAPKYRRYNSAKKGVRAPDAKPAVVAPKVKQIGGAKNGKSRTVLPAGAKYYPADDEKKPVFVRTKAKAVTSAAVAKLRSTITPGTVLILLSGRFRGKRVVFLKQLEKSGLLLVTGACRRAAAARDGAQALEGVAARAADAAERCRRASYARAAPPRPPPRRSLLAPRVSRSRARRPVQGERRAAPPRQPGVRDRDIDQGRRLRHGAGRRQV
jgi:hypothetical protein